MSPPLFAGGSIDRATHLRPRAAELAVTQEARFLPLWRGKPLLDLSGAAPRPAWLPSDHPVLADPPEPPILLGAAPGGPRFALDVSHIAEPDPDARPAFIDTHTLDLSDTLKFVDLRSAMGDLDAESAGDAASAKGVIEWHATHPRCARCGEPTAQEDGGWRRGCASCGAKHFPRTDPVAIMLILHQGRVLLGRQAAWPERMYSLLAGFMEPGETIEEAVRRETFEEAGVRVGRVDYVCSQPWPFPSSLMIGCAGAALDDALTLDPVEIEDALWAGRDEVAASLKGGEARFSAARKGAVARTILERWVEGDLASWE